MAVMRTNRLTSKTTPPKTTTTKNVTVTKKSRPMGMSVDSSGQIKAKNATLTSADWNAEKSNKEYADAIKKGEVVSINDPSIDPETRRLVLGTFGSTDRPGTKDVFGDVEDVAIPKGYKATSYKDIYGSDFNPEEFRGAAKSGKLDEYMKQKGYKEGQSWSPNFGTYSKYKTKPPVSENTPMEKMPVGKAKITVPRGKLKVTEKEEYSFANPRKNLGGSVSMNPLAGGAKTKGAGKRYAKQVVESAIKPKNIGYNREQALFEAKAGTSASGIDFSNMSAADIKSKKQELKQDRRDYRKSSYEGKNVGIKEATMDIRQARKAQTYTRKAEASKLDYFTPGYKKDEDRQGPNRIEAFKGSMENAANRNTMKSKLDAISKKPTNRTNMY